MRTRVERAAIIPDRENSYIEYESEQTGTWWRMSPLRHVVDSLPQTVSLIVVLLLFWQPVGPIWNVVWATNVAPAAALMRDSDFSSPIQVVLSLSKAPILNESVDIYCEIASGVPVSAIGAQVVLPEGLLLVSGNLSWKGALPENGRVIITAKVKATKLGNWTIEAHARTDDSADSYLGGSDHLYVSISEYSSAILQNLSQDPHSKKSIELAPNQMARAASAQKERSKEQITDQASLRLRPMPLNFTTQSENSPIATGHTSSDLGISSSGISPSSGGYITIKGYFYYYDRSNILRPAFGVTVQAYDDDLGVATYLGAGITDSNGYYQIGPILNDDGWLEDGYDVYVRFLTASSARQVNDANDNVYDGYSEILPNVPDGDVWFPNYAPPDQEKLAWWIYYTLYDGWSYLASFGYTMEKSTARWAAGHDANYCGLGSGTHYDQGGQIHLDGRGTSGGHANDPDVILHEYGHNVMYVAYGHWMPPQDYPGVHTWYVKEGVNHGWMEGWACFYPLAVFNDRYFTDTYQGFQLNMETRTDSISYTWQTGDDVDGNVGAALWDIFDNANDGYDTFSDGFGNIWDVVRTQVDSNFAEFFGAWKSMGKNIPLANAAIYQNTIDYNQSPTAYVDSIMPNPSTQGQLVSFSGHGADSDGSVTGHSWRSSLDGQISTSASFSTSSLSIGTHTIYYRVQDNLGTLSPEDTRVVTVNQPTAVTTTVTSTSTRTQTSYSYGTTTRTVTSYTSTSTLTSTIPTVTTVVLVPLTITSVIQSIQYLTSILSTTVTSYTSTSTSTSTIPTVTTVVLVPLTITSTDQSTQFLTSVVTTTVTSYTGTTTSTSTIPTTVALVPLTITSTAQSTQYLTSILTTTVTSYTSTETSTSTIPTLTTVILVPSTVASTAQSTQFLTSTLTTTVTSYISTTTSTSTSVVYTTVTNLASAGASSPLAYLGLASLFVITVGRFTTGRGWRIPKLRSLMGRRCSRS